MLFEPGGEKHMDKLAGPKLEMNMCAFNANWSRTGKTKSTALEVGKAEYDHVGTDHKLEVEVDQALPPASHCGNSE